MSFILLAQQYITERNCFFFLFFFDAFLTADSKREKEFMQKKRKERHSLFVYKVQMALSESIPKISCSVSVVNHTTGGSREFI